MAEKKEKRTKEKMQRIFLVVFFILSIATMSLGVLCLRGLASAFVEKNLLTVSIIYCLVIAGLCGLCAWATLTDKQTLEKSLLSGYVLFVFVLAVWLLLQETGFFAVVKTPESLEDYLERAGIWMPVFYILLQFLQVVILPIPSIVSTVAGVALFGAYWTMIYSLAGILLGSITAFYIGRKLGGRAVAWMVGKDTLKKWQRKMKGKDQLFLTGMFLLPLFPDDILCFLAGLSTMTTKYFLGVIFISRVLAVAATCYSFDFIPFNTWWGISIWIAIVVFIVIVFILLYKNLDKIQNFVQRWKDRKKQKKKKT